MAETNENLIGVIFSGSVSPHTVRGKDLADIIEAIEDMIASEVVKREPDLKKESVKVSLIEIKNGSLDTQYRPNLQNLTIPAIENIARSINDNRFFELSENSIKSLKTIKAFNKKYECETNISLVNGSSRLLFSICSDTDIPTSIFIKGNTTLYGEITRVGGKDSPKIQFNTIDGILVYCDSTVKLAKEAGKKLYTQVGLNGIAKWNIKTSELISFEIESISNYAQKSYIDAFSELSSLAASDIARIEDASHFFESIRYGELAEAEEV
jgi:hypothetical protein